VEEERLKPILESLLFAAGEPVTVAQLAAALEEVPREQVRKTLGEMATEYAGGGRGVMLEEIAGGYQLRTPVQHAMYVRRLLSARPPRLSRPLLETLAIVAYRQPITRPEIEQLRGVDSGGVIDTLTERGLVKINGRKDAPGRPILYTTTPDFLELFGLKDLESLPDLEEFRELEALGQPTISGESAIAAEPPQDAAGESPIGPRAEPGLSHNLTDNSPSEDERRSIDAAAEPFRKTGDTEAREQTGRPQPSAIGDEPDDSQ
jgi:segregation and condensation protein B